MDVLAHPPRRWPEDDAPFSPSPGPASVNDLDPTQKRILDFIHSRPGVHLREICRSLELAMGDVQYHLRRLERDHRITSTRRGLYKFFYPADLFGERQREVLSVLGLDRQRELILVIIQTPWATQEELAASAGVSQATISWHLKRLVELGVVERKQQGRVATYNVARGEEIARLIKTYHPTVWEKWSSRLADIFIAYSEGGGS